MGILLFNSWGAYLYFEFCIFASQSFLKLLWLLWWVGTIGFYVHVKFNIYWPYCYFVVWGTVVTSGCSTFILLLLLWELVFCGITF